MTHPLALDHRTLESYFFEEIEQVQERTGRELPTEVEAYVVRLLSEYARRTHAAGRRSRALALEYMRARSETGMTRATALRRVGDRALYISGVAPRSLMRSTVDVRYVKGIGEAAYREVAGRGALAVLGMLAEMFDEVAQVIGTVVELGDHGKAKGGEGERGEDLLALFERFRRYGDRSDARRLVAAGVLIDRDGSDVIQ